MDDMMAEAYDPCSFCDEGTWVPLDVKAGGYPLDKCSNCGRTALRPVEGMEPPADFLVRKLKERGFSPRKVAL